MSPDVFARVPPRGHGRPASSRGGARWPAAATRCCQAGEFFLRVVHVFALLLVSTDGGAIRRLRRTLTPRFTATRNGFAASRVNAAKASHGEGRGTAIAAVVNILLLLLLLLLVRLLLLLLPLLSSLLVCSLRRAWLRLCARVVAWGGRARGLWERPRGALAIARTVTPSRSLLVRVATGDTRRQLLTGIATGVARRQLLTGVAASLAGRQLFTRVLVSVAGRQLLAGVTALITIPTGQARGLYV